MSLVVRIVEADRFAVNLFRVAQALPEGNAVVNAFYVKLCVGDIGVLDKTGHSNLFSTLRRNDENERSLFQLSSVQYFDDRKTKTIEILLRAIRARRRDVYLCHGFGTVESNRLLRFEMCSLLH